MSTMESAAILSPQVYAAIASVQAAMARTGIAKNRRNSQGSGYNFRGIDDCYNAIAPLMAEHGLCMLPRMLSRETSERASKSGGALLYSVVHAEFDFVSSKDGSKHTVSTYGEAMDSGDKSTNKAMSAAQKYAILQTFVVPTEGDNDTENSTYEVAAQNDDLIKALRTAAMEGHEALKTAFDKHKSAPGIGDVWRKHGASLKAAAAQAEAA